MYLTDRQLRARLDEFQFQAEDLDHPFDADKQIGPCSVDLRLSPIFWKPRANSIRPFRRPRVLDLERSRVMEIHPRRGWERVQLSWNDKITIKPGEMVLGRVTERFSLPSDCAGAIEGRSSYARMGLSIHTAGGFVNPGWRGHMPLTLVNHSPITLRIPVGTPLCQLLVVGLSESAREDYAARADRKYLNDQGGPSYWWRDGIMREIRERFASVHLDARAFAELDELLIHNADDAVLARLEDFLATQSSRSFGNADELLTDFSRGEALRHRLLGLALNLGRAGWTVAVGLLLGMFFFEHVATLAWIATGLLVALTLLALYWAATTHMGYYLTPDELAHLRQQRDRRRSSATEAPD